MGKDVKKETQRSGSLKELLTGRQYRKALIIDTGLKTCQMLTGSVEIQHYFAIIIVDSKAHINLSTACINFGAVRFIKVSLASCTSGVIYSWATPVLPKLKDLGTTSSLTNEEISWIAAIGSPGSMVGSLAARYVSDWLGRRSTILSSALPILTATILVVTYTSVWQLYLAKMLWGMGIGMTTAVCTMYLAEISDKEIRGSLSVSIGFMFNFGNFLMLIVGPLVSFTTLNLMLLPLPVIYFIACWFIPETPYYSLKAGKVDQARSALKKLRKFSDEQVLQSELAQMGRDVKKETQHSSSFKELCMGRQYRKALIICTVIRSCQMLTGPVVIQRYFAIIILDSKVQIDLGIACIILGAARFISALMCTMLTDRVGRRPLIIYSFLGNGLSLALAGGYFYFKEIKQIDEALIAPYGTIVFIGIILAVIFSTVGYNSLMYLLPAELFPLNVKAIAITLLNICAGFVNFTILKGYQPAKDCVGLFGVFTFFAVVGIFAGIYCFMLVPETKGKSLREIIVSLQGTKYDDGAENLYTTTTGINEREEVTNMQVQRKSDS